MRTLELSAKRPNTYASSTALGPWGGPVLIEPLPPLVTHHCPSNVPPGPLPAPVPGPGAVLSAGASRATTYGDKASARRARGARHWPFLGEGARGGPRLRSDAGVTWRGQGSAAAHLWVVREEREEAAAGRLCGAHDVKVGQAA